MSSAAPLPKRIVNGYGLGSIATGTFGTVPGLLLLPYLTDALGVAAGVAGLIVFVPKAWDVVMNPVAGRISDRSTNPAGRRRPFLLKGGLTLAFCFALMFAGPTAPPALAAGWVVLLFLLCATAYAFFQVPYFAMPAEMTQDYRERTALMTPRVAIIALAILISGATAPLIVDAFGHKSAAGYRAMGVYVALLLTAGVVGAWWATKGAPEHRIPSVEEGLRDQVRAVNENTDFRALLLTFVLQALAVGVMLAGVAYVAKDLLEKKSAASLLFVAFVGPALIVTPLWARYAHRRGKLRGWVWSSVFMLVGMVLLFVALAGQQWLVYPAAAVVGVGYSGAQILPMAMFADAASHNPTGRDENRIGLFSGVWTAAETLGLALGPAFFAIILAVGGYVSSTADESVEQPGSARWAIRLGFTILPAALVALSLVPLRGYRLDSRLAPRETIAG